MQHEIFIELVGFNNLWIHFSFREFNCVSMSKIPSQLIQMESWARCLGGRIFSCSRWNRIFFFAKFWNSTNLGMHNSLDNRVLVYDNFFTSQRQSHSVYICIFFLLLYIETYLEQSEIHISSLILSDLEYRE